jgi:hypothetical protein
MSKDTSVRKVTDHGLEIWASIAGRDVGIILAIIPRPTLGTGLPTWDSAPCVNLDRDTE